MTSPNSGYMQHGCFQEMSMTLLPGSRMIPEANEYSLTTFFIKKTPDSVEQTEGRLSSFPCFWPTSEEKQDLSSLRSLNCLLMQSCRWRNPGPVPEEKVPLLLSLVSSQLQPSQTRKQTRHFAGWGANLTPLAVYLLIFKFILFETYLTLWCCQL